MGEHLAELPFIMFSLFGLKKSKIKNDFFFSFVLLLFVVYFLYAYMSDVL